jgi:hypothetical protein
VLETVQRKEKRIWKRIGCEQPTSARAWHTGLSGAPGWAMVNRLLSGKRQRRTNKIHWTVRWCTGLSGEPTAPAPTVVRAISARHVARSNGRLGVLDCPVRQPAPRSNGRMRLIWKEIAHRIATVTVWWCTGLSGAPLDRREEMPSKLISNDS